jgi:hypothetical protein
LALEVIENWAFSTNFTNHTGAKRIFLGSSKKFFWTFFTLGKLQFLDLICILRCYECDIVMQYLQNQS